MGSPTGLIRLMIRQSNCFLVVERGVGMQNFMQERALAASGELRQGFNMEGGQMVTADYLLTPAVVFSENNAGRIGGGIASLFGTPGRVVGALAGGLQFEEAQTSMLLADARSSIHVAAAEGSAQKADLRRGGSWPAPGRSGPWEAMPTTNEGKVIAASSADNYNGIARSVRGDPSLQRNVASLAEEAGKQTKAGAVFNEGDVLRPKLAAVKLWAQPSEQSDAVATLARRDEVISLGKEQDGFLIVESAKGGGWVKKVLVGR